HGLHVMEADHSLVAHLDAGRRCGPGGRATDVEGAHGELRTRFADRLRGDDTHGLADRNRPAACQIAPVAMRAHTVARLAGYRRAYLDLVDALGLEQPHQLLIEQRTGRDEHLLAARLDDVLREHASEHALTERLHHITALDQRRHGKPVRSAAVDLGY